MSQKSEPPRTVPTSRVASPCIGVCTLDPGSELCTGCLRTGDEIALWRDASDAIRLIILQRIRTRNEQLAADLKGIVST